MPTSRPRKTGGYQIMFTNGCFITTTSCAFYLSSAVFRNISTSILSSNCIVQISLSICGNYGLKRSLGQGHIFTSVCHYFCPRGVGGVVSQHAMGRGMYPNLQGGQTPLGRHPPPSLKQAAASYRNVYLLLVLIFSGTHCAWDLFLYS